MARASNTATKATGEAAEESGRKPGTKAAAREPRSSEATPTGGSSQPMVDLEFVRGLIDAVDNSGIDSLEITRAGTRVKISKTPPATGAAPTYFAPPQQVAAAVPPAGPPSSAPNPSPGAAPTEAEPQAAPSSDSKGLIDVTSPMVGTFYRAPAPEAPPYVEVGSRVSKGQTLCILEAMKLMNELEAEQDGVIKEILVENAEPVEYGQPLFRIDPTG